MANHADHIFIPFCNGKPITNYSYSSRESYIENHGESENIELVEYTPVLEAEWVDATKPGQVTCGGNPVYACGNCGFIYGSFELFPSAKYCRECGAKMKGVRF